MLRKPYLTELRHRPVSLVVKEVDKVERSIAKGFLSVGNKFKGLSKNKELPKLHVHDVVLISMNEPRLPSEEEYEIQDNIQAAVDGVMKMEGLTRKPNTGSKPGLPANKQVLIRATDEDHERWKTAAAELGISLAEFVRDVCNKAAGTTECQHPMEQRKIYPWMQRCMKCGKRLTV